MAVKRNNRITSVLGSIDRRVKSLESTSALSLPAGSVVAEADPDSNPTGDPRSTPPDVFRKVIGARIYGPAATGNFGTRVELYFEEDEDTVEVLEEQDAEGNQTLQQIQVFGVNGYSNTSINLSSGKVFKPIEVAYGDWAETGLRAADTQTDWRQTPPVSSTIRDVTANTRVTVNSTIWYNPVVQDPDKTDKNGKDLIVTRAVDSATVTGSNVVVTFNASSHLFKVGDVISVDIPAPFIGLDYYGNNDPDGLFEITAVSSNTISYSLDQPVTSPETYTYDGITRHYVYAVARPYVPEETIWIDDSVEPNKVWVWKKYRWYDTAEPIGDVAAEQDGIAPSPVTNLDATSELPAGSTSPVLNLTWTPPTTRSNGASISGFLDGYDIWYKRSTETVWKKEFVKDGGLGVAAHQIKDAILLQNFTYNIRVYTVDIMGQYSTAATDSILTASYSETLNPPSAPVATSKLGTITVTWDGLDSTGELPVPGVLYIEFHESTTSGFTPSSSTLVESVPITNGGNYIVLTERLFDGTTTYYYKTRFVRQISPTELESSDPSVQDSIIVTGVTGPDIVAGSVTTNKLEAGFVTAELLRGNIIRAGTAGANSRVELKTSGIFAYNSANDPVFSFDTSSSTLTIGGYATTATTNALSSSIDGKISTGGAANDVNTNTTTISGGKITTGSIDASRITVTDTFRYATSLSGTPAYEIKTGQSAIGSYIGESSGIGFYQSGTQYGYLGTWGSGVFELGRDFSSAYISLALNGPNSLTMNFTNGYIVDGTTFASYAAMAVYRTSTAALYVGDSSSATTRAFLVNTNDGNILVGNGGGTWPTTNQSFDVYGRIRATGTITASTSLSSSRFKTDIRNFEVPEALYEISPRIFKYDNKIRYESWKEFPKDEPEISEDQLGAIAEDFIEAGLGGLVSYDALGRPEALDYSKIAVLLIPEIQRLRLKVKELEEKIGV